MSSDKPFSVRYGITPEKALQVDSLDQETRTRLYNAFYESYFENIHGETDSYGYFIENSNLFHTWKTLWKEYFKGDLGYFDPSLSSMKDVIKGNFLGKEWWKCPEVIEEFLKLCSNEAPYDKFEHECNRVLESEKAELRLIKKRFVKLTSDIEIKEVKDALSNPLNEVRAQLQLALDKFSDRNSPDYRNSIKESISAVETLCKKIVGNSDGTLGRALQMIIDKKIVEIHPDMIAGFKSLYDYTSDANGIRHGLFDGKISAGYEEAKYMLISCSAFVNYLTVKAQKANILLN